MFCNKVVTNQVLLLQSSRSFDVSQWLVIHDLWYPKVDEIEKVLWVITFFLFGMQCCLSQLIKLLSRVVSTRSTILEWAQFSQQTYSTLDLGCTLHFPEFVQVRLVGLLPRHRLRWERSRCSKTHFYPQVQILSPLLHFRLSFWSTRSQCPWFEAFKTLLPTPHPRLALHFPSGHPLKGCVIAGFSPAHFQQQFGVLLWSLSNLFTFL